MSPEALLSELEPAAEQQLNAHLQSAKEWFPHEMVPWGQGRDIEPGEQWDPSKAQIDPAVRSALFVNLLTEDNLPYYFRTIEGMFGRDSAWGEWSRRWTAEEGRHSIVMRDYLTVTQALDPVELERARMQQVQGGQVPEPGTPQDGLVYVALQELATRISHFNTGEKLEDKAGKRIMRKVAADENLHHLFYRNLAKTAFELDPSGMMIATEQQVRQFEMPGTGIQNFNNHAKAIAKAEIYDIPIHLEKVIEPVVLKNWDVEHVDGLSDEGEQARDKLLKRLDRMSKVVARIRRNREDSSPQGASLAY